MSPEHIIVSESKEVVRKRGRKEEMKLRRKEGKR